MKKRFQWADFTEKARFALHSADKTCNRERSTQVRPITLLSGCLSDPECIAVKLLLHLRVSLDEFTVEVQVACTSGVSTQQRNSISTTALKVIQYMYEEAWRRNDDHINTGHILLALGKSRESTVRSIMRNYGISLSALREAMDLLYTRTAETGNQASVPG